MAKNAMPVEGRSWEQLREHYEIEKELAGRLRNADREQRGYLYSSLYDEIFQRVPFHPQLIQKSYPRATEYIVSTQMKFIKPFLDKGITFLEVGAGDCAFSFEVAKYTRRVYAIDVSEEITKSISQPPNLHVILSDGSSIPLPLNSVDLAYSHQLMEHLHPDDAVTQLENIYNVLVPGGAYICITPNRLNGPHDISKYFDLVATGFHLREYTVRELNSLFRRVRFTRIKAIIGTKSKYFCVPVFPIILFETFLNMLPHTLRKYLASILPFRLLLDIRLVGTK